jgi:hypothetical protein
MMKSGLIITCILLLASCKSIDIPDIQKSQSKIDINNPLINFNESLISSQIKLHPSDRDWSLKINLSHFNRVLKNMAEKNVMDILIKFLSSEKIISEKYSLLFFDVENYVNLDTGNIGIDVKKLELKGAEDKLSLHITMSGSGAISLSAKYLGIPAGASPDMEVSLDEWIEFRIIPSDNMEIVFEALPKKMFLKTKFYVDFLAWKIPWSEDFELEASEIIKPLKLPLSGFSEISLPIPSKPGSKEHQKIDYKMSLSDFHINIESEILELSSNISLIRK